VAEYSTHNDPEKCSGASASWWVYLLRCADGTLYTGVTVDVSRRLRQHNGELVGGARYTRSRRPVTLLWEQPAVNRSAAQIMEARLRRLNREQKLALALGSSSRQLDGELGGDHASV